MNPIGFYAMCGVLIITNIMVYVMIQMYFEGHEAFNEIKKDLETK